MISLSTLSAVTVTTVDASLEVKVIVFPAANVPDIPPNLILVFPSDFLPIALSNA